MITVKNLTKIYRTPIKTKNFLKDIFFRGYHEKKVLNVVSFEIGNNELVGFIGPNGAGKTTTMKILSGILYPTSGFVNVLGFTPFDKKHEFLKQIAFVMGHKNQLLWELPATDTFLLLKEIYGIGDQTYKKTLVQLVELLECGNIIKQPVKTLSLGQRMRVELIASLLHRPKILFLDEPTIGLDIFAQTIIIDFIKDYQRLYKATIILTSHCMQDVQRLAKRLIMINTGKIIYDGSMKSLIEKYSEKKMINITLDKPLPKNFVIPDNSECEYQFPQLKLMTDKSNITGTLAYLLKQVEFADVTIEDEPLEDIIKKMFLGKK